MSEERLSFSVKAIIVMIAMVYLAVGWAIWFKEEQDEK
jgi:hypothetical protein